MKRFIKKYFLSFLIFLSVFTPFFAVYIAIPPQTRADSPKFPCLSQVLYEDASGGVWCITEAISSGSEVDNFATFKGNYPGENVGKGLIHTAVATVYTGNFGYVTGGMPAGADLDNGAYEEFPLTMDHDGNPTPLEGYLGTRFCSDTHGTMNLQPGDCQYIIQKQDPSSLIIDASTPRLSTQDACVNVRFKWQGQEFEAFYCNAEVDKMCADPANLRAAVEARPSVFAGPKLTLGCNQTSGLGSDGTNPPPTTAAPPQAMDQLPPLSYCYNAKDQSGASQDMGDGTKIVLGLSFSGTNKMVSGSQTGIDGTLNFDDCAIDSYSGFAKTPQNVENCSISTYYSAHPNECECIYDVNARVANGNTYTALGCIPSNFGTVINIFLSIAIGIAALFALFMMMVGGYEIMTNPAGPDEIKEGQQYIINAILGLLLIIFCVIILRIIGVDVLGIGALSNLIG